MLEVVGHPHAVNPDKELRKLAASKGWPILVFTQPGHPAQPDPGASPRSPRSPSGGVVTVGGVIWANARRRRLGA